jgi:tRNA (guanine-N7-)-methyltransferase
VQLDPKWIFGRAAPLQVDLGCGDGSFLCALAAQKPEHNFLGIERLAGRVRSTARKATTLENVRVLRVETAYAVQYLMPERSVTTFHLLFPDPWPKRRHQHRRVVTTGFLASIEAALVNDGSLRVVTDQFDYFDQIRSLAEQSLSLRSVSQEDSNLFPPSTFERHFQSAGATIHRLVLRKISPVR